MAFLRSPTLSWSLDASATETTLLVVSHAVLFAALPILLYHGIGFLAAYDVAVLLNSTIYHLARGATGTAFGLSVHTARVLDHVSATAAPGAVALTALLLDKGGGNEGQLARILLPFIVLFGVLAYPMHPQALVVLLAFLLAVATDRLLRQTDFSMPSSPPGGYVHWGWFAGMVVSILAGSVCFYLPDNDYFVSHSIWHLCTGVALICAGFAFTKNRRRTLRVE